MTDEDRLKELAADLKVLRKQVKALVERCRAVCARNHIVSRRLGEVRQRKEHARKNGLRRLIHGSRNDGMVH